MPPAHHRLARQVVGQLRAQADVLHLEVLALEVHSPGGQQLLEHLQALVEPAAGLVLVDAEAVVLPPAEPTADAEDDLAALAEERCRAC